MSAVQTEETGATSVTVPHAIEHGVGVPFKKRRFLFIRPPSPLLLHEESNYVEQMECLPITHGSEEPKSSVALECPPSSVEEEPSFSLETPEMENINLNEVGAAAWLTGNNIEDKHFSLIQKPVEFSEGCKLSPSSDATNMDQKDKSGDLVFFSGRTQEKSERMFVPSGSCESEDIQIPTELQNIKGCRISTELTLALDRNIGPACWHHGDVPKLSPDSSLSGRESNHSLAGSDRSNWDLNAIMDESGVSSLVSSSNNVPCGNLISASRENAQMARWNLHVCSVTGLNRSKGINSLTRVNTEHADEPVDCCYGKAVNKNEKCESVGSLPFGTHLGDSKSIKVETDCMNQVMNMMDEKSCCKEISKFSKLISVEAEAMQINGPLAVESCHSMMGSVWGCSNENLMENYDNLTGQSYHEPEGDAGNVSAAGSLTNVATKGNELHTSRIMIMASAENNKQDYDTVTKGDLPSAGKDVAKDNAEDSPCYGGKFEIAGCENSESRISNYDSNRVPSASTDHSESLGAEDDDYEDGEVREQLPSCVSQAVKGSEQVDVQCSASYYTGFPSTDTIISTCHASLACEKANVKLQPTVPESDMNGCNDATAACTRNVDKYQSQSWQLSLKERVCSSPNCSFDLGELVEGNSTKHIQEEMGDPCLLSVVNDPSVTHPGVDERVQSDGAISIEGKEDGNSLPATEVLVSSEVTSRDVYTEGSKRRVVTLSSLSSMSSPIKSKLITNRPFQLRTVRKRLPDMALEVERPHPSERARVNGFEELSRGRYQYSFYRNSRSKFGQRSRIDSNSIIHNRDVKRELSPELHNYPPECRITRCRNSSGYRNSNLASESQVCGDSRWVRRRLHGDESCFCRQSSARHFPARKDVHAHPMCMLDHVPQDISPVRWMDMDSYDMVRLRSNGNFRRDLRDDDLDSLFPCSRIPCDYDAGGVARGGRKLASFENGHGLVRTRSNSPVKRSRSPNQGSKRRRPSEGFKGHLEPSRRRSPEVFQGNQLRSPEPGGCFRGKMMRRQSPPYLSQNCEESRRICSVRGSSPDRVTFRIRRYGVNIRDESSKTYSKPHIRTLWSKDKSRPEESNERSLNEERGHRRFPSPYDESDESDMCSPDEAAAPYHPSTGGRPWYRERGHSRVDQIDRTNNRSDHVLKSGKTKDQEGRSSGQRRLR
ncbi:hypothetical protein MLD38_038116 [Melastoma candidum]|uniref:Uncharacterized protein n=1 Tax=Melastoma candidum TaxID=119954 RepID=A0ACB9KZ23_9MYRT|nr:hypothetical protein MLD38_038116 [Melastoma candidum]